MYFQINVAFLPIMILRIATAGGNNVCHYQYFFFQYFLSIILTQNFVRNIGWCEAKESSHGQNFLDENRNTSDGKTYNMLNKKCDKLRIHYRGKGDCGLIIDTGFPS